MSDDSTHGENWKAVPGFEGLYEVSDLGRVRSLWCAAARQNCPRKTPLMLKQGTTAYARVDLCKDRVRTPTQVHILVLTTFVCPRPAGMEGAHCDGNSRNNRLTNLAWKTHVDNEADKKLHGTAPVGERHGRAKLTAADVAMIRASWVPRSKTQDQRALAERYGVSVFAIQKVVARKTWTHEITATGDGR